MVNKAENTELTTQNYPLPTLEELLEAGVHFGHQTRRWNPKIASYLYKAENKIHIFDLLKTHALLKNACDFLYAQASLGKTICFVGTKKQAAEIVKKAAIECGAFYVTERWTGGMITNFDHVRNKMNRLKEIELGLAPGGKFENYIKKERLDLEKDSYKLEKEVGGVRNLVATPDILFMVDIKKELTAVLEARKKDLPVVALVDSNCNPNLVIYPIPGNDDASRSIEIITGAVSGAVKAGYEAWKEGKDKAQKATEKLAEGPKDKKPAVKVQATNPAEAAPKEKKVPSKKAKNKVIKLKKVK